MSREIERRPCQRSAYCRGCDSVIGKGQEMVSTYSWRNRGQHIHFCLGCAEVIGGLAGAKLEPLTVREFLDIVSESTEFEAYRGEEGDERNYLDDRFNFSFIVRALNKRLLDVLR